MPLYEYRCDACGERFEVLQRMGDGADGLTCPHCGGDAVARQLSTFASTAGGSGGGGFGASGGGCGPGAFT